MSELFTVEYDNGELLDVTGDGGYSVWHIAALKHKTPSTA